MSTDVNKQWPSVGMKCVCIRATDWVVQSGPPKDERPPSYRQVCEVTDVETWCNRHYLKLAGRGDWYQATCFRPLVTKTQEEDIAEMWKLVRDIPAEGPLDLIAELLNE